MEMLYKTSKRKKKWYAIFKCNKCDNTEERRFDVGKALSLCRACALLEKKRKLTIHGQAVVGHKSKAYRTYHNVKTRCTNPNWDVHGNYNKRGIKIMFNSFEEFDEYVSKLDNAYKDNYSIDRYPNINGNYEKGNLRWATRSQQSFFQRKKKDFGIKLQRSGKYQAQFSFEKQIYYLGTFNSYQEAESARDKKIKEIVI